MMEYTVSVLTFLLHILIAWTQDIAPNFYCNKKKQMWNESLEDCLKVNGMFVAYKTGVGVDIPNIKLNREVDVWTADYAWGSSRNKDEKLCGFHFMNGTIQNSQRLYGDCYADRYYICKNTTTQKLDVFYGSLESVRCPNDAISHWDLKQKGQNIIPGYYWIKYSVQLSLGTATQKAPSHLLVYCGAYSTEIGKYFVDCNEVRKQSLCNIDQKRSNGTFDKSCFDHGLSNSTVIPESYTTLTTQKSFDTKVQSKMTHKPTLTDTFATASGNIKTISTNARGSTVTKAITQFSWTTESEKSEDDKRKEDGSNLGVNVGLPVGICIAAICVIILSIYIWRRYRFRKTQSSKSGPSGNGSRTNLSSTKQESAHFNKNNESRPINVLVFDQMETNDSSTKQNENVYIEPVPQYAVVRKTDLKQMSQVRNENSLSKEKKTTPVYNSNFGMNNSYCYAEFGNKDDNSQFANTDAIQTSEYSFAKETPDDMDDDKKENAIIRESEYDVTSNMPNYNTSNNIYNKLQKEDNYSATKARMGGNSQNQVTESVYDSASQSCHSGPTDNIYNHLSKDDTYSDVSIRNQHKIQQGKLTDQTYDKLTE